MKYVNETCPICKETFSADSDVVVCPECGTPHHRACYAKVGHCYNDEKHTEKFIWEAENKPIPEEKPTKEEGKVPPVMPGLSGKDSKNGIIGEITIDKDGNQRPVYREISGAEKIGKYTVKDYADVIRSNVNKFIPKFMVMDKTGKKTSWNWAAFFLGPYWLAFRKLWKHAIIAVVIISIIPLMFVSDITDYYKEVYSAASEFLMSDSLKTEADIEAAQEAYLDSIPNQPRALTVASYAELAVSIVYALYGNYLYKCKCEHILENAESKNDIKEKEAYIHRKGGSSFLCLVAFYFLSGAALALVFALLSVSGFDIASILRRYILK